MKSFFETYVGISLFAKPHIHLFKTNVLKYRNLKIKTNIEAVKKFLIKFILFESNNAVSM